MTGLAAVQARMAELQQLVAPPAATSSVGASEVDFSAALQQASQVLGATPTTPVPTTAPIPARPTEGPTTNIAPGSGVSGQDLVEAAKKYIGTPYVWGGESLSEGGLDCSGLVLRSLTDLGAADGVPRVARDQQRLGTKVDSLDDALPGDLLVFGGGSHIAIYVGDGQMIDAPKPGGRVSVRDVYAEPTNIRRILPQEQAAGAELASSPVLTAGLTGLSGLSGAAGTDALASLTGLNGLTAGSGGAPDLGALAALAQTYLPSLTGEQGSAAASTAASRTQWQILSGLLGGAA